MRDNLVDQTSYYVGLIAFFLSWIFISWVTGEIFGSLFAAFLSGVLFWFTYTLVRWVILAFKN